MHLCTEETQILFGRGEVQLIAIGISIRLRQLLAMCRRLATEPEQRAATLAKAFLPEHIYIYIYIHIDLLALLIVSRCYQKVNI